MNKPQIIIDNYENRGFHNSDLEKASERILKAGGYKDCSTICVIPTRGTIPARAVQSWFNLIPMMNQPFLRMFIIGMEVGEAYNNAIEIILSNQHLNNFKYMLTLEEDNLPPPDGLIKLYENMEDYDVVGGLYWTKGEGGQPMIYGNPLEFPKNFSPQVPIADSVQPCNGLGMGFTLFKLEMFRSGKIQQPFFKTFNEHNPQTGTKVYTQDLYFFENAGRAGYRFASNNSVRVGHYDINSQIIW